MTLGKAYDEIMEKIEVTPEMRERVLKRVAAEDIAPAKPKALSFPKLKRYLSAAACLVLAVAGAAVLPRLIRSQPPGNVQIVPQIEEAASLDELSALVGFEVEAGFALPFEPEETTYCAYWNELAQIQYSGQGQTATYRQSVGTADNSGDYTAYGDVAGITAGGLPVTLKGDGGAYLLAVWTDGAFSYSLRLSQGAPETEWLDIISAMAAVRRSAHTSTSCCTAPVRAAKLSSWVSSSSTSARRVGLAICPLSARSSRESRSSSALSGGVVISLGSTRSTCRARILPGLAAPGQNSVPSAR